MKKIILFLSLILISLTVSAQEAEKASKYQLGIRKAFELWQTGKPEEAANIFERIAQSEPDNWLPPFYAGQIYIISSFMEKNEKELTSKLKRAQNFINDATAISKENPEILLLQAQLYTSWIIFDGQRFGMQYSPKATEYYNRAVAAGPDNPRAVLGKAEWGIGSARFFGESTKKYCDEISRAISLFENAKEQPEFYPTFGEDRAKQVQQENCK